MALKKKSRFVVDEPGVFVVGSQSIHGDGLADFLESEGFPDWDTAATSPGEILAEVAGRLCYLSFGGGREHAEYVENLKRDRHGSVLEHATVSFILTGVSRSFTHEIVRHRAGWAYSQLSQRFVGEKHAQMVCPAVVRECRDDPAWGDIYARWEAAVTTARRAYIDLANDLRLKLDPPATAIGIKKQTRLQKLINGAARSVLPSATETKIFCTVNARAFRHFLEMRGSLHADPEIRSVAMALYRAMKPVWPEFLSDYRVEVDADGAEFLSTDFIKV